MDIRDVEVGINDFVSCTYILDGKESFAIGVVTEILDTRKPLSNPNGKRYYTVQWMIDHPGFKDQMCETFVIKEYRMNYLRLKERGEI